MTISSIKINDPSDFEKVVALSFKRQGYKVIMPPVNTKGYDVELCKDNEWIAVQVKNHKAKCNVAQIQKFQNFLQQPSASKLYLQVVIQNQHLLMLTLKNLRILV